MVKRARSVSISSSLCSRPLSSATSSPTKKIRNDIKFLPNKIATAEAAAKTDADPPLLKLLNAQKDILKSPAKGDCVVYWMRMEDLRVSDNRALAQASAKAHQEQIPLITLFVLSPQDYLAHDRGARRIDFTLRNLENIKASLARLHIPLYITSHSPRTSLPAYVHTLLKEWNSSHLFANIEYEVDELRRDIKVCELAHKDGKVASIFVHDKCVISPGEVRTKEGRGYTVYSPFLRAWLPQVEGFSLREDERAKMTICWPAGEDVAKQMLDRFLHTSARTSQLGATDPLADGAKAPSKSPDKESRVGKYKDARDRVDADTTSRLSPYLAAGVISARECIRATLELSRSGKVDASRETGVGRWVQEIAWRDFYMHVLALFPRVSMGRPFQEKFAVVRWETNAHLQAWKDGRTGVPIVDAAMRQAREMGWMHNRVRMVSAMFLAKDLMIDWRLGEKHFMEVLIDGDLASNNGGWQWSASTGVKADPTGDYIRRFVPELAKVRGADIHKPPPALADKLGYPRPLVKHEEARERAIRRYKNPGAE
ncbi:Deoxyribodipyrimidine photo-lyase [Grifola frondosa]|uniref:Deoxyribodipyrimidine photo-lyase n=1 Tax=Grifola frondosa TaxID=5627 RepID=A0A1C7M093_GRIFR|nr:Deoxyribodipyrimidine photo-lyase [Grifola frondosa]